MTRSFRSTAASPRARGEEFGEAHRPQIAATLDAYAELFGQAAGARPWDADGLGGQALQQIRDFAPDLGEEIAGLAAGSGRPAARIAALNARTEILAVLGRAARGECSAIAGLGTAGRAPFAVQNWDWFAGMADNWVEWTIPHGERTTVTVTEYGIVGKIGVNSDGVGVLFNILHHRADGAGIGVPVHVVARSILDRAADLDQALQIAGAARVSASTALTVLAAGPAGDAAATAELWPHGPGLLAPGADGLLLHTNHFLDPAAAPGDREPTEFPDTLSRFATLRERIGDQGARLTADDAVAVLCDHDNGPDAVCCHPDLSAAPEDRYQTLASVRIDVRSRTLHTHAGNPCGRAEGGRGLG